MTKKTNSIHIQYQHLHVPLGLFDVEAKRQRVRKDKKMKITNRSCLDSTTITNGFHYQEEIDILIWADALLFMFFRFQNNE